MGYKPPMKILITGATGFIGSSLLPLLKDHSLIAFKREPERDLSRFKEFKNIEWVDWSPPRKSLPDLNYSEIEAVLHLAGEGIADAAWDEEVKKRLYDSRVLTTRQLVHQFKNLSQSSLKVFMCASAVGFYGNRGEEVLVESSRPGKGFLAQLCIAWEQEVLAASEFTRVVVGRQGIVLQKKGGALKKMLPVFQAGVGGKLGSGEQWVSWISLKDLQNFWLNALTQEKYSGVYNCVSPEPVTNTELTKALSSAIHRPAFLRVPAFALKMMYGEMAQETLLSSQRVQPSKLKELGFSFSDTHLAEFLKKEFS